MCNFYTNIIFLAIHIATYCLIKFKMVVLFSLYQKTKYIYLKINIYTHPVQSNVETPKMLSSGNPLKACDRLGGVRGDSIDVGNELVLVTP